MKIINHVGVARVVVAVVTIVKVDLNELEEAVVVTVVAEAGVDFDKVEAVVVAKVGPPEGCIRLGRLTRP